MERYSCGDFAALQTWRSRSRSIRSWHWVTVTALESDDAQTRLRVSSWGKEYIYPLSDAWRGKASLVWFEIEKGLCPFSTKGTCEEGIQNLRI